MSTKQTSVGFFISEWLASKHLISRLLNIFVSSSTRAYFRFMIWPAAFLFAFSLYFFLFLLQPRLLLQKGGREERANEGNIMLNWVLKSVSGCMRCAALGNVWRTGCGSASIIFDMLQYSQGISIRTSLLLSSI